MANNKTDSELIDDDEEEKKKRKPYKEYSKTLIAMSDFTENVIEAQTKVLIPILFVLTIAFAATGLGALFSVALLADTFVHISAAESWKDEFKNTAKKTVEPFEFASNEEWKIKTAAFKKEMTAIKDEKIEIEKRIKEMDAKIKEYKSYLNQNTGNQQAKTLGDKEQTL